MRVLTREQFQERLNQGRLMVWATLQDRQDFLVQLTPTLRRPVRDVTKERNHHTRQFIGSKWRG